MCGGVGYKIKNIPEKELKKHYSTGELKLIKLLGRAESFFWQKDPVLPIQTKDGVQLKIWGNKNEELKLPKTGWAKEESLKIGKWDYLHPEIVDILVDRGLEKKAWFDFPEGTKGYL